MCLLRSAPRRPLDHVDGIHLLEQVGCLTATDAQRSKSRTNASYLRDRLVEAIDDYPPNVRLDYAGLRFIDSSAFGVL